MSEFSNRVVRVEHTQVTATSLKVLNLLHSWLAAIIRLETNLDLAWFGNNVVLATVLVSKGVSTDDDWLGPSWNKTRDAGNNDGLTEDSSVENVPNGSVGASPHLFETELFNATFVRSNSGALDSDLVLLDSICAVNSNLIVSGVARRDTQIVVFSFDINVWVNVLQESKCYCVP